jgi:hypothetical protein
MEARPTDRSTFTSAPEDDRNAVHETVLEEFVERELAESPAAGDVLRRTEDAAEHGPLPIIVAVSGHRDLRDEDLSGLSKVVRDELLLLQERYPSTSFILLSALADGADRLVARAGLSLGVKLIVPLPMPQAIYEADFDAASLTEFRSLLAQAEHTFTLPVAPGATLEGIRVRGAERDLQYAQLGAYLAHHSQILIALWDGLSPEKMGGTSQIVHFKLHGVPEPFAPPHSELDAPDSGPVLHIHTPRKSTKASHGRQCSGEPLAASQLYPPGFPTTEEAAKAYADIYQRIDLFNSDALKHREDLAEHIRESKEYVLPEPEQALLPPMLGQTLDLYAIADVLSQRFQRRTRFTLKLLLSFVFFAAASYDAYSHFFEEANGVMGMYLVMFFFAFLSYQWAARAGYQTKYLDYRALAEGLRVQFFWKLAEISDSVADYYMRKQKSELDWIRDAIRSCMTETCGDSVQSPAMRPSHLDRLKLVQKHWVADQEKYFAKVAHRDHHRLHVSEKRIGYLFFGALICAAAQMMLHFNPYLLLGIGLFPVLGALIHTFVQKNALFEQSKQYDRMSVLFHRARVHLADLITRHTTGEAHRFLAELGREALVENGDWILTHRERPLEVPKGA